MNRAQKKIKQAVWNQIHFVHRSHWHASSISRKAQRRLDYWGRVVAKWSGKINMDAFPHFIPRKPRGKRKVAFDAFCARERAWRAQNGVPRAQEAKS